MSLVDHLLFLCSDDIIRSLEQNGRLLHNFVLMISLDLMKSSEVRIAGDRSIYLHKLKLTPPSLEISTSMSIE